MSGGHSHAHGDAHGDAHSHAHGAGDHASHGPAEIPPAPIERVISPARADFAQPWPGKGLLWPLVWTVVAGLLALLAMGSTGEIRHDHAEGAGPVHGDSIPR